MIQSNHISTGCKVLSLFLTLGASAMLGACADQDMSDQLAANSIAESVPTDVTLEFTTEDMNQQTRAAISSKADSRIYNLWLYVFDAEGKNGQLFRYQNPESKLNFRIASGQHRIYALANVDEADQLVTFSHDLQSITDESTLLKAMATLNNMTVFRNNGHMIMSGTYDGKENGLCEILPLGKVSLPEKLKMKRIDARITFNVSLDPSDAENKKFKAISWQVFNAPVGTGLFVNDDEMETNYFTMAQPRAFEDVVKKAGIETSSFTFYALENNQRGEGATQWSDREMKTKDAETGINTDVFKYAPKNATYVKLRGEYSYDYLDEETGLPSHQNAYVEYTIHLGYVGEDAYNNYECKRNTSYTYNVLVRGVDDIILKVDVENDEEDDEDGSSDIGNGSEGDVVIAHYFFDFDSHYDRSILQFDQQTILDNPEMQGFFVSTPFDKGFYYLDEDGLETPYRDAKPADQAIDYDWIKFRRCDMKSDSIYNSTSFSYYDPNNVINIKQLIHDLRTGRDQNGYAVYDRDGKAYYTLFVNENYYTVDPRTGQNATTDFWKQFVNQEPREMYIFCHCDKALDEQSSVTVGYIQVRQRAIQTHYNINASSELQTAWGVETRNETGQAMAEIVNPWNAQGLTRDNAVKNLFLQLNLVGMEWNKFLSTDTGRGDYMNQLNDNTEYSSFIYACIQRNRDENGNGIIDREEIKWVPAASNHYSELWIGSNSLPNDARLYPLGSTEYRRYLTSSGEEFMSEEGGSIAPYGSLYNSGILGQSRPLRYDYRCIRLLGFDEYDNNDVMPQPIAQVDETNKRISLQWLDEASRRSDDFIISDESEVVHHNSYLNYPYTTFEYRDAEAGNEIPAGWRLPNDREMSIMVKYLNSGWGQPTTTTYYKTSTIATPYLTGKVNCFHYGVYQPQEDGSVLRYMALPEANPESMVRLVKDVK